MKKLEVGKLYELYSGSVNFLSGNHEATYVCPGIYLSMEINPAWGARHKYIFLCGKQEVCVYATTDELGFYVRDWKYE